MFRHLVKPESGDAPGAWDFETPHRLRPCCALGTDLTVRLGSFPVAGFRLDNVVDVNDLGEHQYNSGIVSLENEPSNAFISTEKNGLVYTCRAGVIDVAHVRDYDDWMVYLVGRIRELEDSGGTIELPSEGGKRYIHLEPIPRRIIAKLGREQISFRLARYTAMQLAIWHETATWYGWSSWGLFPETASAFSPEDLYSDLVATRLAEEIIRAKRAGNKAQYEQAMTETLPELLRRLGAAPAEVTRAALRSVDGRWWDSRHPLPDKEVVLRRNFQIGPEIHPWKLPTSNSAEARSVRDFCHGSPQLYSLHYDRTLDGQPMSHFVHLELQPDGKLAEAILADKPDELRLSQEQLPAIVRRAQAENREEFGSDADRP